MAEIRKDRVEQIQQLTPTGAIVPVYRVTFHVGDDGPFQADFPQADFAPERVKAEMERIAATIRAL